MSRSTAHLLLAAGVVLIAVTAMFQVWSLGTPAVEPACAYQAPILCAELPPDGPVMGDVLKAPPNRLDLWKAHIWLDLPFLLAYALLLAGAALSLRPVHHRAANAAVILVVLGAALDLSENFGILTALSTVEAGELPSDAHAAWVRVSAHAKFVSLELGCAVLAGLQLRSAESMWFRVVYGLVAFACLAGVGGLFAPSLLELGLLAISVSCLLAFVQAMIVWRTSE